jgi:hypothetical protein
MFKSLQTVLLDTGSRGYVQTPCYRNFISPVCFLVSILLRAQFFHI